MDKSNEEITLKEYFESRLHEIEKSTNLAAGAMDKRLEGMNEFRDQLKDQASKFITRSEIDILMDRTNSDIRLLRESKASLEGKASQQAVNVALLLSLLGLLLGAVGIILGFIR